MTRILPISRKKNLQNIKFKYQKQIFTKNAAINLSKDKTPTYIGCLVKNYEFCKTKDYVELPENWPSEYLEFNKLKPCYKIDLLWSNQKGAGTKAIKEIVQKSLNDYRTEGRVILNACCMDGHSFPGGFYYKLGFRFENSKNNKLCEHWIRTGGNIKNAPEVYGTMFLPKENIYHCLSYNEKFLTKMSYFLKEIFGKMID